MKFVSLGDRIISVWLEAKTDSEPNGLDSNPSSTIVFFFFLYFLFDLGKVLSLI